MSRLKKFNIILGAVNFILLAAAAILMGRISLLEGKYAADSAKSAWDGGKYEYSQVSVYLPRKAAVDVMGVYSLRSSAEAKLKEASLAADKENTDGRLWLDCASGESELTLEGRLGSCAAAATGTFGDYFLFHPEKILFGSYYTSEDINIDRIVIDKECSWQLFGAMETVGMPVNIGNRVFYVAAVVDSPDDETDRLAYGNKPRAYMPFEVLKSLDGTAAMTCYEACMPNEIRDFAYNTVKAINPAGESAVVVDQSARFGLIKLIKEAELIPESVMVLSEAVIPHFENRIRTGELYARLSARVLPFLLIIPVLSLVYLLYMLTRLAGKGARSFVSKAEERYQKKISERYYRDRK